LELGRTCMVEEWQQALKAPRRPQRPYQKMVVPETMRDLSSRLLTPMLLLQSEDSAF
jgi:hypothetical protein